MSAVRTDGRGTAEADRERQARRLGRTRRWQFALTTAASIMLAWFAWASGLSTTWAQGLASALPVWLATPLLVAALLLAYWLALLPQSYLLGYRIARHYGLSTQTPSRWLIDWLKTGALAVLFGTAIACLFYGSVALLGDGWWWACAAALSVGVVLVTYVAPYLLLPLFFRLRPLRSGPLQERIVALFRRAGARPPQVAAIELSRRTTAANAAVIGLGSSRRVVLGDTLLEQFSLDEIETVVAHELGHHVHGDIWRGLAAEIAALWVGLALAAWAAPWLFGALGLGDWRALAAFPLLALAVELAGLATMPLFNAWSRARERAADRYALALTGKPAAFAAAMERLAGQNLVERRPPRWAEWLLATHPAVADRIAAARAYGDA